VARSQIEGIRALPATLAHFHTDRSAEHQRAPLRLGREAVPGDRVSPSARVLQVFLRIAGGGVDQDFPPSAIPDASDNVTARSRAEAEL